MLRRLSRSLSFRLLVIFLALAAAFVYFSIAALRWVYDTDDLRELVSGHLSLHIDYVLNDIGDPPRVVRAIAITRRVPVDIRIAGPDIDWASDDEFPRADELDFNSERVLSDAASAWLGHLDNAEFAQLGEHRFLRIGRGDHAIIVSSPKIADTPQHRRLAPIIVGVGLSLVMLAYLAVRWLFRPVGAIRLGAARIGQGRFDERIKNVREDQLGDLASDINTMADDVQSMLDAKRQLLLGISHELRSPLSRMRLAIEIAHEADTPGIDTSGLRSDIEEMDRIISTLLEAERLNARHAALHLEACDPRELVDELLEDFFRRESGRIRVSVGGQPRRVRVDEARVKLLIKNLMSNALRYSSQDDGPVHLSVDVREDDVVLRIQDRGPGIPESRQHHIGEPFFRADPSRTRHTGGSGLGLYLATLIARAHGGELRLDTSWTDGAAFEVRLPG